jgi:hypothetical protein
VEGHYFDHWTPGLTAAEACKPCVDETLCRMLAGQSELTLVEGLGRAAAQKAAGFWIHVDSMHPLHCLPGNCISCDDYAVASGLLKAGQNLQQNPLPPASFLEMLGRGGAVKQNRASADGRAELGSALNASSGPSAAAVCTGGSTACLAWEQQMVGTCCRLGHHGTLCAHCDAGWVKVQELCMPCQSFGYPKLFLLMVLYGGMVVYFWHKARQIKEPKDVDQKCQSAGLSISTFFFQTGGLLEIDGLLDIGGSLNLELNSRSASDIDVDGRCLSTGDFYGDWVTRFTVPLLMAAATVALCLATKTPTHQVRARLPAALHSLGTIPSARRVLCR